MAGVDVPQIDEPALTRRTVPIALLRLAGPIIASMISRTVMSFVDFVMVSQLGTEAQAAIMPAGVLLFCIISFGMGTLSIINAFVSQHFGRNEPGECAAYAWQGVYIAVVMGLAALPGWFVMPGLFTAVGHEPAVREMEITYVQIGLLGIAPTLMGMALVDFFNGIHRPMVGFFAALISNVFNAIANYALIFGHFGFPAMGIAGAAWGTAAASAVFVLVAAGWLARPELNRTFGFWANWRPSWHRIVRIVRFGAPAGLQHTIDIFSFTVFTLVLVGQFGTEQLAAHNLSFKFLEISFMPTVGLGVAVTAAVGKAIGQNRPDLAKLVVKWAAGFALTYMGLIAVGYLTLRYQLAGLLSDDPVVIEWAARVLILCAVFQLFDALGITHSFALRGAGDTHWQLYVMVIYSAVLFLGGGFAMARLKPEWGLIGPWLGATAYIVCLGLTYAVRWYHGKWQTIQLIDPREAARMS